MLIGDLHFSGMVLTKHLDHDIQIGNTLYQIAGTKTLLQQLTGLCNMLGRNSGQHFQQTLGIAADHTKNGRSINSLHAVGIGNGNTLNILDNVAAAPCLHADSRFGQQGGRLGGGIRNGNRLSTAQSRNQLLFQEQDIILVNGIVHENMPPK